MLVGLFPTTCVTVNCCIIAANDSCVNAIDPVDMVAGIIFGQVVMVGTVLVIHYWYCWLDQLCLPMPISPSDLGLFVFGPTSLQTA